MLPGTSLKGKHFLINEQHAHTPVKAAGVREARSALEPKVAGADDVPMNLCAFCRLPVAAAKTVA